MGGMAWFLIIFFVVLLVLIGVSLYGSWKDRQKTKTEFAVHKASDKHSRKSQVDIYLLLNRVIEIVGQKKKEVLNNSTLSMNDVNDFGSYYIDTITKSDSLRAVYDQEDRKTEMQPIIEALSNTKPSKWEEEAFFATNVIRAKSKVIIDAGEFPNSVEKAAKIQWKN